MSVALLHPKEEHWLCLSGMLGSGADWQGVFPALWQRTRRVEMLSPRELFVCLSKHSTQLDLMKAGEYLVEHTARGTCLCAYSLGGRIALHALLARPNHWAGAVLVGAHTGIIDARERKQRAQADARWVSRFAGDEPWEQVLASWQAQASLQGNLAPKFANSWHKRQLGQGGYRQQWASIMHYWSTSKQDDLLPRLKNLNCPVLWLTGQQDQKFSHIAQLAAKQSRYIEAKQIPEAGHRLPWQQVRQFWLEMVRFRMS